MGGDDDVGLVLEVWAGRGDKGLVFLYPGLGVAREPEIQALLGIPDSWAVATIMPLGKPVKQLTKLRRKSVEDILARNTWENLGS